MKAVEEASPLEVPGLLPTPPGTVPMEELCGSIRFMSEVRGRLLAPPRLTAGDSGWLLACG